jgi:hypothetical protein
MLIIRVELHSAITHRVTEIARMEIINDGSSTNPAKGNYIVRTLKGRSKEYLDRRMTLRLDDVKNWPRLGKHVWYLVAAALQALGY